MKEYSICTDEIRYYAPVFSFGDSILLTGTIYTARDAAHKKIFELIEKGKSLPFDLMDSIIYYAGPTPTPENFAIGSCGPTTASRLDRFTPKLMQLGVAATIGKGQRDESVRKAVCENKGVYFCAIGGAGAVMAKHITDCREIAFPELGCESVKRLTVEKMPLIVAYDSHGGDIFKR